MRKNPPAPDCMWCKRPSEWAKAGISTGFKVHAWCFTCGKSASTQLCMAKGNFDPCAIERMRFTASAKKVACPICGALVDELEKHHPAPRAKFGKQADLWGVIECCRACHRHWHKVMGCPIDGDDHG